MQGNKKIIDLLNKQLTLELTSMDQYLAHAKCMKTGVLTNFMN